MHTSLEPELCSEQVSQGCYKELKAEVTHLRIQYPNVPKEIVDELARFTFSRAMSLTTGAEMVVMRRRMQAAKRRKVEKWWHAPVTAISL